MTVKKYRFPVTGKFPVKDCLHNKTLTDPYRWLEDQNSPETRQWLAEQTEFARSFFDSDPHLGDLKKKFRALRSYEATELPIYKNGYYYYAKRPKGKNLSMIFRRKGLNGTEEILLDPRRFSKDESVSIGWFSLSHDGKILYFNKRTGGADETTIHFYDLKSGGEYLENLPEDWYFGCAMLHDNSGVYYSSRKLGGVFLHLFGTDLKKDRKIFGDGYDMQWIIGCGNPPDSDQLMIIASHGSSGTRTEIFIKPMAPGKAVNPVITGIKAAFEPVMHKGLLYVTTNWKAPRRKLMLVDPKAPEIEKWVEIIPQGEDCLCEVEIAGDRIVAEYQHKVSSRLCLFDLKGRGKGAIELPGIGSVSGLSFIRETKELFLGYTTFTSPYAILRFDSKTGVLNPWAGAPKIKQRSGLEIHQVFYPSKDGTEIPMYLVHKKGLELNGNNPVLLYGYGGFNVNLSPFYSPHAIYFAERGGVFAVANLRGGGEFGEKWHQAGMMEKKQNVFDDFHAGAEWLIKNRYTKPEKLAIFGGSNGGLLVGAALTQRPDLFKAVVCTYPLLDMLRYHKFLVGSFWVTEYGSADKAGQFKYLLKYSPYHNVKNGTKYPAVMFVTGDMDTRVDPCHARKMTALLQEKTGSDLPVLLRYDTKAGHVRGQSVRQEAAIDADIFSFLLRMLRVS
ncbi:MAG: prolyl oligopeptidase family serine peptidase [Candidatus Wallbacteria bacterium]|nr:prolyl oligopeptidase family serine peptidase [Candidatus Wallbacteria bacterium]